MASRYWLLLPILLLTSAVASQAASFDCAKARTPSEKLICATPELSALDDKAAAAYRTALTAAAPNSPIPKNEIRQDQRAWLTYVLSTCRDVATMRDAYVMRIATLEFTVHPAPPPAATTFTELTYQRNEYSHLVQIRATPPHPVVEQFNAWVRARIAEHSTATGYAVWVEKVGDRYLSAYILTENYYQGAAHGAPVRYSLTLDLKSGRMVTLESLFRKGPATAARLAKLVNEDLLNKGKHGTWQYEETTVKQALAGDGAMPPEFQLTPGGFIAHYPPYCLGPYSSGDANIYIPYTKLADIADPNGALAVAGRLPFTHKEEWEKESATAAAVRPPWNGTTKRNPKDGQLYVYIPAGQFAMGCNPNAEQCNSTNSPPQTVVLTKGFWLSQDPATQAAYQRVTGRNPSFFSTDPANPVESITWNEADSYCRAVGGRLPTEAEWEYAARAGTTGPQYGKVDDIAWHGLNSASHTHPVGQKLPNAWGLYDMIGNVSVWVADWSGRMYTPWTATDPVATAPTGVKLRRGASYFTHPSSATAWMRDSLDPTTKAEVTGVRCVVANL